MTRRLFVALLCLALPVAASAQQRRTRAAAASAAPRVDLSAPFAQLLPADTFFYVEVSNLASAAEEVGGVDTLYAFMQRSVAESGGSLPFSVADFRKALGSSAAVGVRVPPSAAKGKSVDPEIAVIVRAPSQEVVDLVTSSIATEMKKSSAAPAATVRTVRGVRVTTFGAANPKDAFSYAAVGTTLVFGTPSAVTKLLTSAGTEQARTLAQETGFQTAASRAPNGRQLFGYLNGEPMVRAFNEGIESTFSLSTKTGKARERERVQVEAIKSFVGLDALVGGSFSAYLSNGSVATKGALELDRSHGGLISVLSDGPPIAMRSASLLPSGTDVVVASSVDAIAIYDLVLRVFTPQVAEAVGGPPPPSAIELAEGELGMKLRDEFLAAFGNEVVVGAWATSKDAVAKVAADGTAKPSLDYNGVVMFEVRAPQTIDAALAKLTAGETGENAPVHETYKDVAVTRFDSMTYAYLDGFGIVGSSADVNAVIDATQSKQTLASDADYAAAVGTVPENVLLATYLSPELFELASKEVGERSGIPRGGDPVKTGVFFTLRKDQNGVFSNFQLPIPNLRLLLEENRGEKKVDVAVR